MPASKTPPEQSDGARVAVEEGAYALLAQRLRHWLVSGLVQSPSGAFYAWVDATSKTPAFEYPEITGYALTHLAGLPDPSPEELSAGRRAGSWLVGRIGTGNLSARDGWDNGTIYNFDLAMMSNGLIAFGTRFDISDCIAAGRGLADRLCRQLEATKELSALPVGASSSRSGWSTDGRALMIKATQCLLTASENGTGGRYVAAATAVARMAGRIQRDDGRIVTHPADNETMCHPHLYAVEGLWIHASATGDEESLQRARAGTEWVWRQQLDTGGLPRYVQTRNGQLGPEQVDVTAQALRAAALVALPIGQQADAAAARMNQLAVDHEHTSALPYQPQGAQHLNTWATLFCRQALGLKNRTSALSLWQAVV